ncbi:MAG: hypothetical protein R3330_03480, partial [Saprospiraceae bacterium]|nr:hypothetical protein [Saprospiraceae bacterium]
MNGLNISRFVWLVAAVVMCTPLAGQQTTTLQDQLRGKQNLAEIMTAVDDYYQGRPEGWRGVEGNDPRYIHWKRWEWYMANRLGPSGEFVDINERILRAAQEVEQQIPAEMRTINTDWDFIGPSSTTGSGIGRADRIAFHPSDPNTFYVGTPAGGLWKTTDGGSTWSPLTDFIASLGISGIVVSWANPNIIYILTGDGDSRSLQNGLVDAFEYERRSIGVLKSTDGGDTWKQTATLDTNFYIALGMRQDPTDANVLLVVTSTGIYRTGNGGNSWTQERTGSFWDVEFKPGTNRAYACTNTEVVYSNNGGLDWFQGTMDVPFNGARRVELAVTPANTSSVYMLVGDVDGPGVFDGLYLSTNNGVNYFIQSNTPNILGRSGTGADSVDQAPYDHTMAVSPINDSIVLTGAVNTWRSLDAGQTWAESTGMHDDIHQLAYNPLDGTLYNCTDGGVYKSTNDGDSWTSLFVGFETSQFYHMTATPLDDNYLLGGLQDNGVKQREANSSTFIHIKSNDGFSSAYFPNSKDSFYFALNRDIWRNENGTHIQITPLSGDDKEFFGHVITHRTRGDTVLVGNSDIFRSFDGGQNWTNEGFSGSWAMTNCPSNGNRFYSAGASSYFPSSSGGLWRSDNIGLDWTPLHTNPGFPPITSGTKITDVAVSPVNSFIVVATIGGFIDGVKVYRSTDGGSNWTPWNGTLPNVPVNCAAITASGAVYIGTDIGVFYRSPAMTDWMPWKNGLPNVPVTDIVLKENIDRMYCSTFGRGVWKNNLIDGNCPTNLALSGTWSEYYYYQASDLITMTTTI